MTIRIAIIFGAGPGLGAAVAQALSKTHSLLLLSRSLPGSLPRLELKIPDMENRVLAYSSDGSASSLKDAMAAAKKKWPEGKIDVGVANGGPAYSPGGFLEQKEETIRKNMDLFV